MCEYGSGAKVTSILQTTVAQSVVRLPAVVRGRPLVVGDMTH